MSGGVTPPPPPAPPKPLLRGPDWPKFWLGCFAAGLGVITKGVGFLPLLVLLPRRLREAVQHIYRYARTADDIADDPARRKIAGDKFSLSPDRAAEPEGDGLQARVVLADGDHLPRPGDQGRPDHLGGDAAEAQHARDDADDDPGDNAHGDIPSSE